MLRRGDAVGEPDREVEVRGLGDRAERILEPEESSSLPICPLIALERALLIDILKGYEHRREKRERSEICIGGGSRSDPWLAGSSLVSNSCSPGERYETSEVIRGVN